MYIINLNYTYKSFLVSVILGMPRTKISFKKSKVVYKEIPEPGVLGLAYKEEGDNLVEIETRQSDRELFLTTAHELFHNLLPELSERQIILLEKTFGVNLWKTICRLRRKWEQEVGKKLPRDI